MTKEDIMENCNKCKFINITEEQQTDKRIDHICQIYMKRVLHRSNNPKVVHNFIYPCEECNGAGFEER
jgi:hypothetical protein